MSYEVVLTQYPDGHRLSRDSRQWIVQHPPRCLNAKRGNLLSDYAKYTYFTQEWTAQEKIRACHLLWSVA